ncbi:MAG: hypothetical protein AAF432_03315 [Planctomycetota bacterium]
MARSSVLTLGTIGATCMCVCALWFRGYTQAHKAHDNARASLVATSNQAKSINTLRAADSRVALQPPPKDDLIAELGRALAAAGIPSNRLQEVSEPDDEEVGESGGALIFRRLCRVVITGVSPQDTGRVLESLRTHVGAWSPSRIEMIHDRTAGDEDVHQLILTLSAVYVE